MFGMSDTRIFDTEKGFIENLRDLLHGFAEQIKPVFKYKKLITIGFAAVILIFTLVEIIALRPSIGELPLILLGGVIWVLRFISLFFMIVHVGIAFLVYESVFEGAKEAWTRRYIRRHNPKDWFTVPNLRFKIPAAILGIIVFHVLLLPSVYLLYVLPDQNAVLADVLSLDRH